MPTLSVFKTLVNQSSCFAVAGRRETVKQGKEICWDSVAGGKTIGQGKVTTVSKTQ